MTVSMSGETCKPCHAKSSPTLQIAVTLAGSATRHSPSRKRAAPTPPASTVMRMGSVGADSAVTGGLPPRGA